MRDLVIDTINCYFIPSYATKAEAVLDSLWISLHTEGIVLFPHRWKCADTLVVSCQTVNSRLDENQSEFGIFVFTISLEMFSDRDSLKLVLPILFPLGNMIPS
jgi:hypothetical protein